MTSSSLKITIFPQQNHTLLLPLWITKHHTDLHMIPLRNQLSILMILLENNSHTYRVLLTKILLWMHLVVHCQHTISALLTTDHQQISRDIYFCNQNLIFWCIFVNFVLTQKRLSSWKEHKCSCFAGIIALFGLIYVKLIYIFI